MTDKELICKLDAMVKALQKTKKKTDKTRILLDARKDFGDEADELMAFFKFLLDPAIVTGLSDAKINKKVAAKPDIDIQYLSCGYLYIMGAGHNTGSDTSIATIQNYLHKNPEHEEFLKRLFTKNLPIGVEAATINKVYGEEIIPVWEVQQGYPIDKVKLKDGIWFSLSQKMNGNRGTLYRGDLISRQAQKFEGLDHIKNDLLSLYDGDATRRDSWVFDGELMLSVRLHAGCGRNALLWRISADAVGGQSPAGALRGYCRGAGGAVFCFYAAACQLLCAFWVLHPSERLRSGELGQGHPHRHLRHPPLQLGAAGLHPCAGRCAVCPCVAQSTGRGGIKPC